MVKNSAIFIGLFLALFVVSISCNMAGDAAQTIENEYKPSALLQKYTVFKDLYAQLDAKRASAHILQLKIADLEDQYKGQKRSEWLFEDVQAINQWKTELGGLKASYNNLAAQYNADMAKSNLNFTNIGDLPKGANSPLPRAVAPYLEN